MIDVNDLDWDKGKGLLPAIIQDESTLCVLMLGYMNKEALEHTLISGRVTFFSRAKQKHWVKGETSGNFLDVVSAAIDCDKDTILIKANPQGPVCHTGTQTCFGDDEKTAVLFLQALSKLVKRRHLERPEGSYTTALFEAGQSRIAQKVGEEAVELALAHVKGSQEEVLNECADLVFHMMVLLEDAGLGINAVCRTLIDRHQ